MKTTAFAAILLLLAVLAKADLTLTPERLVPPPAADAEAVEKCDFIAATACGKKCPDDWTITGYYHGPGRDKSPSGIQNGRLVAVKTVSLCNRCYVRFTIVKDGKQREAACEEFVSHLRRESASCENCVEPVTLPLTAK